MRGVILTYSAENDTGFISAEDGQRYAFTGDAWMEGRSPAARLKVDFDIEGEEARQIYLVPISENAAVDTPSSQSIAALVCAILAIVGGFLCQCCCFLAIPAVIFGHLGLNAAKMQNSDMGKGLSLAGLIIGYLILAVTVILIIVVLIAMAIGAKMDPNFKF